MLVLYNSKTTSFSNLGLGVLKDLKSDALITEELNGSLILEFEYSKNGFLSNFLVEGNLIKCNNQLFRIKNITKSLSDVASIKVLAQQYFQFDMSKNFLSDVAPTKLNGQNALSWIVDRAENSSDFVITGNCTNIASARYVRKNVSDAIYNVENSILNRFGGELEFNLNQVYLHSKRGTDKGFSIRYRKNLKGLEFNLDFSTVVTKICPQGKDELLLDDLYVESPRINNYYQPFFQKFEFNIGIDEDTTEEQAKALLKSETLKLFENGIDLPEISIKVDFVELSKCIEYKKYQNLESCSLGDTVSVIIPEFNINTSVRVVKTVYNDNLNRLIELELGTVTKNIVSSQNSAIKNIENVIENPISILASAKKEATELINHPFKGNLFIDKNTGVIYLADTDDLNTAKNVWKWSMGGLGFSSNGINGDFATAITQNGSIVADFITTGKLNTNVIEGYNDLLLSISNIKDVTKKIEGSNFIEILDAVKGSVIRLSIKGNMSLLFPSNQTFLSNQTFFRNSKLIVEDVNGNIKEYETGLKYLNSFNDVYDEFVVDENGVYVIRRIGIDENSSFYVLENQIIEKLPIIQIELNDGYNKIYMSSFENLDYELKYAVKNDYTDVFAKKIEMNSMISMQEQNIDLKLIKKVDNDNIIAQINMSTEKDNDGSLIQIEADKLNLKGKKINLTSDEIEIDSTNFSVDKNGNMRANDGYFSGNIELTDDSVNSKLTIKSKTDSQTANSATLEAIGNRIFIKSDDIDGSYQNFGLHRGIPSMTMTEENKYYTWLSATNLMFNKYSDNSSSTFSANGLYFDKGSTRKIGINADDGNISCVSLTQTSLADKKKNFELLDNALEIIKKTDIYKYHLKNQKNDEKKRIGFVIGDDFNYSKEITSLANDGVDIYSMVSVVFKAVKEQQLIIEKLEKRISELEEKTNGNNN